MTGPLSGRNQLEGSVLGFTERPDGWVESVLDTGR